MSLILPSTAAPAPSASPGAHAATRYDEQGQNNPGSFGEALARSLKPAGEKVEKPTAKTATLAPARRQAGHQKADTEDLVNAMGLSFTPLESRLAKVALPGRAATSGDNALPGAATAANPLPTGTLAPVNGSPDAPGVTTDTDAQSTLASALAAASQKSAGPTPLQATAAPVNDGAVIQMAPQAIAGQSRAANTGLSDQSSKRDDKDANNLDASSATPADLALVLPHGTPKAAANATAAAMETAALSITGSHTAADATASISTALPMTPATAAMQAPVGVAASNAPSPVATASLTQELGSPEWGKALGQHVIQMGNAGHQVAELQLNPPGLGPLKVTLSMSDNQMQAMFVSAHSSVRAAVEAALPQLRTTLADSGISLGNTSVGAESQQQTAFSNNQNSQPERGAYRRTEMTDTATLLPARPATEPVRRSNGLSIDTYA